MTSTIMACKSGKDNSDTSSDPFNGSGNFLRIVASSMPLPSEHITPFTIKIKELPLPILDKPFHDIKYSRPRTVRAKELVGIGFEDFIPVFEKYISDNYNSSYYNSYIYHDRNWTIDKRNYFRFLDDMIISKNDTLRILIARTTGLVYTIRDTWNTYSRFVFQGSKDTVFCIDNERRTYKGYCEIDGKQFIYRFKHLRRSTPYRLLMHDSIDALPRRYWKPLVPGTGDAFAVRLYIENYIIRKAEVTHFYDVLVDRIFECPDTITNKGRLYCYRFPEGSPESEYLKKYEPGEKEYFDSIIKNSPSNFIEPTPEEKRYLDSLYKVKAQ